MRRAPVRILAALPLLVLAQCAAPPDAVVELARQAILDARASEAEVYAPDAMVGVLAAEEQMDRELANQARRAVFLRRWESTRRLADLAAEAARAATADAAATREQLRLQLEPELPALREALPVASGLVERAAGVTGVELDTAGLGAEIQAIDALVVDALGAYERGHYRDASSLSNEAKQRLDGVQRAVQEALALARGS